jgi:hypothetical protein
MKKIRISNELFHEAPTKLPPRKDLRKPRVLDDPDLENDIDNDPDLEVSTKVLGKLSIHKVKTK